MTEEQKAADFAELREAEELLGMQIDDFKGEEIDPDNEPDLYLPLSAAKALHEALSTQATALATARAEAEALREDAERWRAFFSSERFYVMGAAGFDWDKAAVREPRDETNWLHFTLNVWDRHPAGNDEQGVQGRAMLLSYVDYLRRAALTKGPTQ